MHASNAGNNGNRAMQVLTEAWSTRATGTPPPDRSDRRGVTLAVLTGAVIGMGSHLWGPILGSIAGGVLAVGRVAAAAARPGPAALGHSPRGGRT